MFLGRVNSIMAKKFICILITLILIFTFVSCNDEERELVSVFYYTYKDDYTNSVRSLIDRSLATDDDIKFANYNADGDAATQLKQIQKAIEEGSRVLVVNAASKEISEDITKVAKESNRAVVFFDRPVSEEAVSSYSKSVFVSSDYEELGRLQGKTAGKYLVDNYEAVDYNSDGKISYVLYRGEEDSEDARHRTEYCIEEIDKALSKEGKPAVEYYDANHDKAYLTDPEGTWSLDFAKEHMLGLIKESEAGNAELAELIIANNDAMALGAAEALRQHGYNGSEGKRMIPIFGIGGTVTAENAVHSKLMTATVEPDSKKTADVIEEIVNNFLDGDERFDDVDRSIIEDNWRVRIDPVIAR